MTEISKCHLCETYADCRAVSKICRVPGQRKETGVSELGEEKIKVCNLCFV